MRKLFSLEERRLGSKGKARVLAHAASSSRVVLLLFLFVIRTSAQRDRGALSVCFVSNIENGGAASVESRGA